MMVVKSQSEERRMTDVSFAVLCVKHVFGMFVVQLKANATELQEDHSDGLLARWIFSPGASTTYVEDATNADYDFVMHICKYNNWTETDFPLDRFGDAAEIVIPFN